MHHRLHLQRCSWGELAPRESQTLRGLVYKSGNYGCLPVQPCRQAGDHSDRPEAQFIPVHLYMAIIADRFPFCMKRPDRVSAASGRCAGGRALKAKAYRLKKATFEYALPNPCRSPPASEGKKGWPCSGVIASLWLSMKPHRPPCDRRPMHKCEVYKTIGGYTLCATKLR